MIHELITRIQASVSTITEDYEIILVNDGSPDNTWEVIEHEAKADKRVKGLNLSRNFGQHYAITAGLAYASGEWVVVMDCDLQDRPEEIPNLYAKAQEGYDIVLAKRMHRRDAWLKRLSSSVFNAFYSWMSGMKKDKSIGNYGIYRDIVVSEFNRMPEYARSFGTLLSYVGFKTTTIEVEHAARMEGHSSYSLRKLLKLTFDVIISNSNKPLRLAVSFGFIMSLVSFILALYNVVAKLVGIISLQGFTSTIFSIWFVGGLLLSVLGIIGLYIGKIFDQVKGRQLYIVRNSVNIENK